MSCDVEFDSDLGLLVWRFHGHVTSETAINGYRTLRERPEWSPSANIIILIDESTRLGDIEPGAVEALQGFVVSTRIETAEPLPRGRTAIVCPSPVHLPLIQLHTLGFREITRSEERVFENEIEAYAWLAER